VAGDETFSTAALPCSCSVRTRQCHVEAMVQVTEYVNLVQWRWFGELQVVQLGNPCNLRFLAPLDNPLWIVSCTQTNSS